MSLYTVEVSEITSVSKKYTIEASSVEEAREKAAIGETVEEEKIGNNGVLDRVVETDPVLDTAAA